MRVTHTRALAGPRGAARSTTRRARLRPLHAAPTSLRSSPVRPRVTPACTRPGRLSRPRGSGPVVAAPDADVYEEGAAETQLSLSGRQDGDTLLNTGREGAASPRTPGRHSRPRKAASPPALTRSKLLL